MGGSQQVKLLRLGRPEAHTPSSVRRLSSNPSIVGLSDEPGPSTETLLLFVSAASGQDAGIDGDGSLGHEARLRI